MPGAPEGVALVGLLAWPGTSSGGPLGPRGTRMFVANATDPGTSPRSALLAFAAQPLLKRPACAQTPIIDV